MCASVRVQCRLWLPACQVRLPAFFGLQPENSTAGWHRIPRWRQWSGEQAHHTDEHTCCRRDNNKRTIYIHVRFRPPCHHFVFETSKLKLLPAFFYLDQSYISMPHLSHFNHHSTTLVKRSIRKISKERANVFTYLCRSTFGKVTACERYTKGNRFVHLVGRCKP